MKNWQPSFYNHNNNLQFDTAINLIQSVPLRRDYHILDIGCGTGNVTRYLANLVPDGHVTGVDIDPNMIAYAKEHSIEENISYTNNDATKIMDKNKYDVVFSFWTLSWIPLAAQAIVLKNVFNSLKVNGIALLMYPLRHKIYDYVDDLLKEEKWAPILKKDHRPRPFISFTDYEKMITEQELREFSYQKIAELYPFTTEDSAVGASRTVLRIENSASYHRQRAVLHASTLLITSLIILRYLK